ncbi:hypothetical protein GCM10027570_55860 [Streptomonospora sediminis]
MPETPLGATPLLEDARVLVTGACGGIGAACAAALRAAGAAVAGTDLHPPAEPGPAPAPGPAAPQALIAADLARAAAAEEVVESAWGRLGGVDILVNAAGLYPARAALDTDAGLWDRVLAVNTRAPLLLTLALARRLTAAGRPGAVVNISSGAAARARTGTTCYAASKAALDAVTRSCALELAPQGIRVNAVAPGYVHVRSDLNPIPQHYADAAGRATPLGRAGAAADIVPAVLWLAGPESAWVTGAVLPADGGAAAGSPEAPTWL